MFNEKIIPLVVNYIDSRMASWLMSFSWYVYHAATKKKYYHILDYMLKRKLILLITF